MNEYSKLKELLYEKRNLFLVFQNETVKLKNYTLEELEEMETSMSRRDEYTKRIDELDNHVRQICSRLEEGEWLLDIMKNKCDYGMLTGEQQELYRMGQGIFRIISEIQQEDMGVLGNMNSLILQLESNIKRNNEKSKITGYFQHMSYGVHKGALYNKKS